MPTELTTSEGKIVRANEIYDSVFTKQKAGFEHYIYERLNVPRDASSLEVSLAIKDFMHSVESEILPDIDLTTVEGTQEMVNTIIENLPHGDGFSLIPEMASRFLAQHPPISLLTKLGYSYLDQLLEDYDPLDIMALATWSEEREYSSGLWDLLADNIRPEHFVPCKIKPLVVTHEDFPSLVEMKDSSALDRLTTRIVVSNIHKGKGRRIPKTEILDNHRQEYRGSREICQYLEKVRCRKKGLRPQSAGFYQRALGQRTAIGALYLRRWSPTYFG